MLETVYWSAGSLVAPCRVTLRVDWRAEIGAGAAVERETRRVRGRSRVAKDFMVDDFLEGRGE